ncbi:MAG: S1C family serine protease [Alkalispirochaetaceae bacterium]
MSRATIYSSDRELPRRGVIPGSPETPPPRSTRAGKGNVGSQEPPPSKNGGTRSPGRPGPLRPRNLLLSLPVAALLLLLAVLLFGSGESPMSQEELTETIRETVEQMPPERSSAALAHEIIGPSVVRVSRLGESDESDVLGVGTGVVIDQRGGIILTSLHVVAGSPRIGINFADGFETEGRVISQDPSNDLAVVEADVVPEGVPAAAVVSTDDVALGDEVVVVGHPFGIGPSVSSGVVSGLGRRYSSQDGSMVFDNLIQFDAAANPGNSGGPLVNRNGEVLGIVSAIYNPTEQRVFIGIGFAVPIETAAAAAGESPF